MQFLSDAWFAVIADAFGHVQLPPTSSARLVFDADGSRWHLTVHDGRVRAWGRDGIEEPDCTLQWDAEHAQRVWHGGLHGNDALRVTTVVTRSADGDYVGIPAPMDLGCRPELAALPRVPAATLRVQYRFRDGPFGSVDYALAFDEGRVVEESLEALDDPDVTVEVSYRAMALVRAGEMSILHALEDGTVDGRMGPLAMLAGISESPEFEAAQLATGRHALALATLGELRAAPAVTEAVRELAAASEAS